MERRDFLSAIPGLAIGGVGMSVDDLLAQQGPQTDWTAAGGGSALTPRQMRVIIQKLEELDKWQKSHVGIDAWAAGPDYPHPSQKVRTIYVGGLMRLDDSSIQMILSTDDSQRGIYWYDEFKESPTAGDNPMAKVTAAGGVGVTTMHLSATSPAGSRAPIIALSGDDNGAGSSIFLEANTSSISIYDTGLAVGVAINNAPLELEGQTSDFGSLVDGMLWYRSDTDKFRARINGATENLATESYVTTAVTLPASNKQPFAAKTGTYTTTNADGVISVDATSGSFTVTLVSAVSNSGLTQTFKKINAANVVTIDANSTQTIDGALTYALSARFSWVTVVSDGANWLITGAG